MHGIFVPHENTTIPFSVHSIISRIPCQLPTDIELEEYRHLQMTEDKECAPYDKILRLGKQHYFQLLKHRFGRTPTLCTL